MCLGMGWVGFWSQKRSRKKNDKIRMAIYTLPLSFRHIISCNFLQISMIERAGIILLKGEKTESQQS